MKGAHLVKEAAAARGGDDEPAVVRTQRAQHAEQILAEERGDSEVEGEGRGVLAKALVEQDEGRLLAVTAAVRQELLHGEVGSAASVFAAGGGGAEVLVTPAGHK